MHAAPLPDSPQALKALAVSLLEGIAQRDAQIAERDQRIDVRTQELVEATTLIEKLKFQLLCFQRARYGKKSEAIGADQIALWEAELDADIEALQGRLDKLQASLGAKKSAYRETPKRQLLPDTLPRIEQHLEPQNTVCDCGAAMTRIGEDVAETLQMIPAKFYVQRRIRGKWACRCCQKLVMAPVPPAPIDKGLAGASVLAQVIVSKYQDHLPLHRQEGIYARMGVTIARSTMAGWIGHQQVSLEPLTDLLASRVIEHSGLQADETPVRVLDPGSGKTATGYLWAYRTLPSARH